MIKRKYIQKLQREREGEREREREGEIKREGEKKRERESLYSVHLSIINIYIIINKIL